MTVTASEFQTSFWEYLGLLTREDVLITLDGETIAQMSRPKVSAVDSIRGILKDAPKDLNMRSVREERLSKYKDHV